MAQCNPNDMLLFAKAAELRSISAAARASGKPKATVSRAVARLEEALNARLLERSSRHVVLTENGQVFLTHCQRVAEELQAGEAAVGELQHSVRGLLRVAVPTTFGRALLAPTLPRFLLEYPDIRLELRLTHKSFDPIGEGFDVVVRPGPLPDSGLMSRELGRNVYGVYASPAYLATRPLIVEPQDLSSHRVLDAFAGAESTTWEFARDGAVARVEVRPRVDLNDAVMRRDCAIDGVGIAMLPTWMCNEAIAAHLLQPVIPGWHSLRSIEVFALWPSRRHVSPRLRVFLDYLAEAIPKVLSGTKQNATLC